MTTTQIFDLAMARYVVGPQYAYHVVERNGHEHISFYYEASEYDDYQREITNAITSDVLVTYGAIKKNTAAR